MQNADVAAVLAEWAELLERQGSNRFKSGAYRRAAERVASWPEEVADLARKGRLQGIPGVGASIAARIEEILAAGPKARPASLAAKRERHLLPPPARPKRRGFWAHLKGDLHTHTAATDGRDTMLAMAREAEARGYEYIAITDHSKDTRVAGGLSDERMKLHLQRIRRLDDELDGITVLAGAEVDILKDGRLDYPASLLRDMDVTVCSVHFRHKLTGPEQTERILKGMSHEDACILGHPTTRRRGLRTGLDLDLERIYEAAADQGWAIEMNGSPERLDLDAKQAKQAAAAGAMLVCDSDAHATSELALAGNACREAEKAGLRPSQVLNTRGVRELRKALRH